MQRKELFYLAKSYKSGRLVILRPALGASLTDALEDAGAPYALEDGRAILPAVVASERRLEPGESIDAGAEPRVRLIVRAESYHHAGSTQHDS